MKVLLQQNVKGTGKAGEIVDVSDGYARNYLLPQKLATPADAASINAANIQKSAAQHRKQQAGVAARELAQKLKDKTVNLSVKVGENGKLFGSITAKEISAALQEQLGVTIDKKKISLAEPIRALGKYEVTASLFEGVSTKFFAQISAL